MEKELLSESSDMVMMTNKKHNPNYVMWAYCNFMRLSFCKADKERHLHLDKETFLNLEPLLGIAINLREETQYFFLKISISTPDTTEKKCRTFPSPMSWEHHSINAIEMIQGVEIGGFQRGLQ